MAQQGFPSSVILYQLFPCNLFYKVKVKKMLEIFGNMFTAIAITDVK